MFEDLIAKNQAVKILTVPSGVHFGTVEVYHVLLPYYLLQPRFSRQRATFFIGRIIVECTAPATASGLEESRRHCGHHLAS
jgi:hypothetical protein